MVKQSLAQWLQRLEGLHPRAIELGLARVASVAEALDLLPVQVPVVSVAGTNGKGSTVAVLEALLDSSGRLAGVYTSPHLLRFNERIRVGGVEASDEEIVAAFERIDSARGTTSLTYFEFATLAALLVFRARQVEVMVLEVGLGGRLDAVNIVDPTVAVITRIDLDHQDWLGDTRDSIAREKAGIMRAGRAVVIGDPQPPATLLDSATTVGAQPVLCLGSDFGFEPLEAGSWRGRIGARVLPELPRGPLLPENICSALQAASLLGVETGDGQLQELLRGAGPRGRCELRVIAGREYLLDVAHNPAAVQKMVEYSLLTHCKGKTISLFSVMADKDVEAMIAAAGKHFEAWFVADQPGNSRAASGADIAAALYAAGQAMVSVSKNLRQALRRAQGVMREGDRLVIFGSFSTIAAVLPLLETGPGRMQESQ
jgi:dihydrofolate synthase/folylpolyglutamate synthase